MSTEQTRLARLLRGALDTRSAGTVAARHLLRGTAHVSGLPAPFRDRPAYAAALEAYRHGDLRLAHERAREAGPAGRMLARLIAGELELLTEPPSDDVPAGLPARPAVGEARRVLHLVTNAWPETTAGYTVRTRGITEAQAAAGLEVHVATRLGFPVNRGRIGAARGLQRGGVAQHRLPAGLPLRADDALRRDIALSGRLAARLRPDVLHAHSNHVNGQVALALRARLGVPVVYEVRGLLEETWRSRGPHVDDAHAVASDHYRLTRAAETRVMRAADAVVTLSETLRTEVVGRGVPAERVVVVPNCVDDVWLAGEAVVHAGDARSGDPLTLLYAGTLNDYEGVDLLLDAVALLRSRGLDVRAVVAGGGPAATRLHEHATSRGLSAAVRFTGVVDRDALIALARTADAVCLPRRDLPVTRLVPPLKPVEAMALGLPVVAADLPPLRELLAGRGVLVRPDDADALAAGVLALADPARRAELGAAGRDHVARTRTWRAAAASHLDLYGRLVPSRADLPATDAIHPTAAPVSAPTAAPTEGALP